jgi:adenosylcobinamide-GDP ribazoletransferase
MRFAWPPNKRYWTDVMRHAPGAGREWLADASAMLAFMTVLPVRGPSTGVDDFTRALRAAPVAGLAVGLVAATVLAFTQSLGLTGLLGAVLAVAVTVGVTGALHEDALSDVADGFGGGTTRERKLEIMRDSRIGTYGACALALALMTRVAAIAGLLGGPGGTGAAAAAVIASAVLSRTACVAVLHFLAPARRDGLGVHAGRPAPGILHQAVIVGAAIAVISLWVGAGFGAAVVAAACAVGAAWAMIALARAQIGGQTGDVAGACQQAVECAVLVATAAAVGL